MNMQSQYSWEGGGLEAKMNVCKNRNILGVGGRAGGENEPLQTILKNELHEARSRKVMHPKRKLYHGAI